MLLQAVAGHSNSGPVDGNTDVVVVGLNFAAGYCLLCYGTDVLPASADCAAILTMQNTVKATAQPVDVTLNGQQYHQRW